ncbi:ribosomal protein L7/L12 C-terminal domain-containing protein [Mycena maculata]|uniref:Ribosomal protein L7/L12 C-terminal domain-containing protein n=1 Tax=Mycena maculata TaxID=230809 RepID=A0AAD7NCZ7_9AGAR|nr:ribosomal protein L7/L12 C-terminal domain-containing protein [Mycena maculata]
MAVRAILHAEFSVFDLSLQSRCSSVLRAATRPNFVTGQRYHLFYQKTSIRRANSYSRNPISSRWLATATEAAPKSAPPLPPPGKASKDPTVSRLVDDISGLTLLQAADLVTHLKSRLNIQEIAMPTATAAAPAATAASDEPAEEKPKEKTVFNVQLESFEAGAKPKIIREVKALVPNLTLIDAKKFVESLPKVLKENLPKEEAEKLKKTFEALGAVVKLD